MLMLESKLLCDISNYVQMNSLSKLFTVFQFFAASFKMGFRKDAVFQMKFCLCITLLVLCEILLPMKRSFWSFLLHYSIFYWSRHGSMRKCPLLPSISIKWLLKSFFLTFQKEFNVKANHKFWPENLISQLS